MRALRELIVSALWRAQCRFGSAALLLVLLLRPAAAQEPPDSCAHCHEKELAAEADHPHRRSGIGCVDCHGGDPGQAEKSAAKAPATGYKGRLTRRAIAETCGGCHAEVTRMHPFGLPTDQLALYRSGKHGRPLFERDDRDTAVCTDCHGVHGILERGNPASPVHPANVPATCGKCHGDAALMAAHDLDPGVTAQYEGSVHGQLLAKGDASAPQCATCHGHHGDLPSGVTAVAAACSKCHVQENEFFRKSPHRKMEDQDLNTCVVCHGSHKVRHAALAIYDSACKICHEAGDGGMRARDELRTKLQNNRDLMASAEAQLEHALALGLATDDHRELLEQARFATKELPVVQHALDPALLDPIVAEATTALTRLQADLRQVERDARRRRLALAPVVAFLLLMSFGFWRRFRRIHAAGRSDGAPPTPAVRS